MLKFYTTLSSLCLLLSSHCVQSEQIPHWQHKSYIHTSFTQIALQGEHSKSDGRLHKWQRPIVFSLRDQTGDHLLHKKMVTQQFKHLSAITGHPISPAKNSQNANVTIMFSTEQNLDSDLLKSMGITNPTFRQSLNHNSVCMAQISYDHSANINRAIVIIPVDRARAHGKLMACVVEELTQIMGLPNDSTDVYPSIFNDHSFNNFLTGLDYLLLQLLYSDVLKSGMTGEEVEQQIHTITQTEAFSEHIKHAEGLVRQHSLENWLD
ncbi:DUF2927 domain-containing protein [Methylophaga thiooxydans]|uniref:DUF2927 domain-containing protein n=1 Tax=Methylophaga thiooxydans TaxID=392484 RepID=UPI002354E6D1|nr:DUF2927 domain-containing protein [Methylophaga thiooxydans]